MVLLAFLVGCGSGGGMGSETMVPPATGGAIGAEMDSGAGGTAGASTGGSPGTGGAQAGGSGGSPAGGTGGTAQPPPDALPLAPDAGTTPPDAGPQHAQACAQESGFTVSGCGYLGAGSQYVFRKMGGASCRACSVQPGGRQVVGCAPESGYLCVASCGACCYDKPGSVCQSDADCCAPLRCKDGAPGQNRTCS